jgi:hypothetical protein
MEIRFANKTQCAIADLFWVAQTEEEVNVIIKTFGNEARVVYDMIIAAAVEEGTEQQTEFPEVMNILESLK